jgi:hypothetical protein
MSITSASAKTGVRVGMFSERLSKATFQLSADDCPLNVTLQNRLQPSFKSVRVSSQLFISCAIQFRRVFIRCLVFISFLECNTIKHVREPERNREKIFERLFFLR